MVESSSAIRKHGFEVVITKPGSTTVLLNRSDTAELFVYRREGEQT